MARYERLALFCSVTRVGPLDGGDALGFAVTLSAGFLKSAVETDPQLTDAEIQALQPWAWQVKDGGWAAWGGKEAAGAVTWEPLDPSLFTYAGGAKPAAGGNDLTEVVRKRVEGLGNVTDKTEPFFTSAGFVDDTGNGEKLHALLATLATRPAPIPHQLGLAFLLKAPKDKLIGFHKVVLAPRLGAGKLGEQEPEDPASHPPAALGDGAFSIEYAKVGGRIPLKAFLFPAEPAVAAHADLFLDLETGWVKRGPDGFTGPAWAGSDWTEQLEPRAASAFDLAQRLTDLLREKRGDAAFLAELAKPERLPSYRRAVLGLTRDVAGMGLTPVPSGRSLFDDVMDRAGIQERRPIEEALKGFDENVDLGSWSEILRAQIPSLSGLLLSDAPRAVEDLPEEIADLDRLCSAATDETNLRRLVVTQWERATAALEPALRRSVLRSLEEHLAEIDVRQALARTNLQPFWNELISLDRTPQTWIDLEGTPHSETKEKDEGRELRRRLGDQLIHALSQRLASGTRKPDLRPLQPRLGTLRATIEPGLRELAVRTVESLLPGPATAEGDGSPTAAPHAINLQLDRVGGLSADRAQDLKDLQHSLTGFGVLMRAKGTVPWHCLNMAQIHVGGIPIDPLALVPSNLGYRNGLRETGLSYNNHPLSAESPAHGLAGSRGLEEEGGEEIVPLFEHPFVDLPEPDPDRTEDVEWARLPALQFGRSYEALPFAVLNGGVLPKEVRKETDPTELATYKDFAVPNAVLEKYGRTFPYLRRVRVGLPRLERGHKELPSIPSTVHPIARELESARRDESVPLLLLTPESWKKGAHSFIFRVRKPATDLLTWDRWVANDLAHDDRIPVWREIHQESAEGDLTLDDPALAPCFHATLTQRFTPGAPTAPLDEMVPVYPNEEARFPKLQSKPAALECSTGVPKLAFEGGRLVVRVPQGEVWELRLYPLVERRFFEGADRRFHPEAMKDLPKLDKGDKSYFLHTPYRFLIEVAQEIPANQAQALWKALAPEVHGSRVTVRLKGGGEAFPWASRVELRRQAWRWHGRSLSPFPPEIVAGSPDASGTIPPRLLAWEAEAFAERDDADCARLLARIQRREKSPLLFEQDRGEDRRALLYRFGITAWSRYEGLIPAEKVDAGVTLVPGKKPITNPWRRLVLPCRWVAPVPKPKVKLVVPMTEAADRAGSSPAPAGLLVVLNEPWYEIGGLAESLQVELLKVQDGRPELGPDPILTGKGWTPASYPAFEAGSPFGHTFDTGTRDPLFLASSFVLPPPPPETGAGRDLSWHFAKLRFQRKIAGAIVEKSDLSEPTSPIWVQFLPEASAWTLTAGQNDRIGFENLSLAVDQRSPVLVTKGSGRKVKAIEPMAGVDADSQVAFARLLLITQRIRDVRGQRKERYVALYRPAGEGAWERVDGAMELPPSREGFRARIVELQERKAAVVGEGTPFWSRLFPDDKDGFGSDAQARIVRVSPPIEMLGDI